VDLNHDGVFDFNDIIIIAVGITAILAALVALRRQVVKPVSRWVKKQLVEVVQETVTPMLEEIRHEVTANDGSSLRDLVKENHVETKTMIAERDDALKATLRSRDAAFARLASPAARRLDHVEAGMRSLDRTHSEILGRIEELGNQSATDTAKVLQKIDTNTESIIDNQGDPR